MICYDDFFSTGNYHDSLTDARTATELHPNFSMAILKGMNFFDKV